MSNIEASALSQWSLSNDNIFLLQIKSKIDQACRVAEDFTKLYYETIDKRRHVSYTTATK